MSIKVGKSFKALIAAGAALVMAASMAACGPSAGTPSEAKSSDTGTSSSANAKARSLTRSRRAARSRLPSSPTRRHSLQWTRTASTRL